MGALSRSNADRPREWRRKVLVPARLRSSAGWGDARILNVSSRGMMIHSPQATEPGSLIELRRGNSLIIARVVWKEGPRAGLQSDEVLPLTDILCLSEAAPACAVDAPGLPRPSNAAEKDEGFYRRRARMIEYVFALLLAVAAGVALSSTVGGYLSRSMDRLTAAIRG